MNPIQIDRDIPPPEEGMRVRKESDESRGSTTRWGDSKKDRYKWNTLGKPGEFMLCDNGEFMLCDKSELHIDHGYQRDSISNKRVTAMAADWDWVSCGCLCVAERDGKWYVIDGQHRKLAADKRSDINQLPCLVFDLESRTQEAQAFVDLNSNKTAVNGVDRFKAMIVAGDQTAIGLNEVLTASGRPAAPLPSATSVACIILLWSRYSSDPDLFKTIWPLICEMSVGYPIPNALVRAVWWTENKVQSQGMSLLSEPFKSALVKAGTAYIKAEIDREKAIVGLGGARVEGAALVKWLNRQKLGSKFKIDLGVGE